MVDIALEGAVEHGCLLIASQNLDARREYQQENEASKGLYFCFTPSQPQPKGDAVCIQNRSPSSGLLSHMPIIFGTAFSDKLRHTHRYV